MHLLGRYYFGLQKFEKLKMGILSSKQSFALQEAKRIREDLYSRIEVSKLKYRDLFESISPEKKESILVSSATELVELMDQGECSSLEILLTFIERTIEVGVANNYVIDEMFEKAVEEARRCDQVRKAHASKKSWKFGEERSECLPPFFGVPVSVKETIIMKNRQSYGGFVSRINSPPQEDTAFMELIQSMGMIPFVRSNVPQACKTIETNNNMFGYCLNSRNRGRSCGGSSGGQGGLVGSLCSPVGLGSDIGGSLRIPAQFNGLCTLKPSLRNERQANAYYGKFAGGSPIVGEPGLLTKSVQDLITFGDWMYSPESYQGICKKKIHPHLQLTPLKHSLFEERPKVKVGVVSRLQTLECSRAHQNCLQKVEAILKEKGHATVPISLPNFEEFYFFMVKLFICHHNIGVLDEIRQKEPFIKEYSLLHFFSRVPWIIKRVIIFLIRKKQPRLAKILSLSKPLDCREVIESMYEIQKVHAKKVYETFVESQIDALVMPGFAIPSPRIGSMEGLQYCLAFLTGWNVMQYPAGNLPVKLVEEGEDCYQDSYNDTYTKNMQKQAEGSKGMPVGVQVVALPYKEENVLYVMSELQREIKFNLKYGHIVKFAVEKDRKASLSTTGSFSADSDF